MCALCRQALEANAAGVIHGFYWSILLLCAIPLLIFAAAAAIYLRLRKKAKDSESFSRL